MADTDQTKVELEARIRELEEKLESGLRARGFDPGQLENVPLTPELARLKAERDELSERLETLVGQHS